jgi:hypothetical protein
MIKNPPKEKDFSNLSNESFSNESYNEKVKSLNLYNIEKMAINHERKFKTIKRGRKTKIPSNNSITQNNISTGVTNNVHNKYSHDNIKRRIKALVNNYIIQLLNHLIKQKYNKVNIKFLKMNIRVTKDIGIEYNRNLLNTPLREIIVNVSNKYKDKDNNKNCIKFIEEQKDNEEIMDILNTTYEQLYIKYLNSNKNDSLDNSFEAHKEKMLKLYGKEYFNKFVENSKNFIKYFKKGKNRKCRKFQEVKNINIPLEKNKNDIVENNIPRKNMVSSFAQTELYDINAKIIAIY